MRRIRTVRWVTICSQSNSSMAEIVKVIEALGISWILSHQQGGFGLNRERGGQVASNGLNGHGLRHGYVMAKINWSFDLVFSHRRG